MSKKSNKRRPIKIRDEHGFHTEIQWVGPNAPNAKYVPYLRLESGDGAYLGSLSGRQMRTLQRWLNTSFKEKP